MHHLHQAFCRGYEAGINGEEDCPHVPGTTEHAWWWEGWNTGVIGGVNGYLV